MQTSTIEIPSVKLVGRATLLCPALRSEKNFAFSITSGNPWGSPGPIYHFCHAQGLAAWTVDAAQQVQFDRNWGAVGTCKDFFAMGKPQVGHVPILFESYEPNGEIDMSRIHPITSERQSGACHLSEQLLNLHPRMQDLRRSTWKGGRNLGRTGP